MNVGKPDPRPEIIKLIVGNVHYLHFGCILFLITIAVTVVVSLLTQPIDKDYVINSCTFQNFSKNYRQFETSCTA